MRTPRSVTEVIAVGLMSGCAGMTDAPSGAPVSIPLQATSNNAGEVGRATLIPQGETTIVMVEVSSVPRGVTTRPVHLYTFIHGGVCDKLSPQPAYSLNERVLAQSPSSASIAPLAGPFTVSNTAPVSIEKLRQGAYAIVVRTAPADGNLEIFCGRIG